MTFEEAATSFGVDPTTYEAIVLEHNNDVVITRQTMSEHNDEIVMRQYISDDQNSVVTVRQSVPEHNRVEIMRQNGPEQKVIIRPNGPEHNEMTVIRQNMPEHNNVAVLRQSMPGHNDAEIMRQNTGQIEQHHAYSIRQQCEIHETRSYWFYLRWQFYCSFRVQYKQHSRGQFSCCVDITHWFNTHMQISIQRERSSQSSDELEEMHCPYFRMHFYSFMNWQTFCCNTREVDMANGKHLYHFKMYFQIDIIIYCWVNIMWQKQSYTFRYMFNFKFRFQCFIYISISNCLPSNTNLQYFYHTNMYYWCYIRLNYCIFIQGQNWFYFVQQSLQFKYHCRCYVSTNNFSKRTKCIE
jgi:hypothetical protein